MAPLEIVSIVDDEAGVLRATSSLVRSLGFSVNTFISAEAFLGSGSAEASDCILSDVHMTGMNGIDLFTLLQTQGNKTPFIFMTAFAEQAVRERVGPDVTVLKKPFDADVLTRLIRLAVAKD